MKKTRIVDAKMLLYAMKAETETLAILEKRGNEFYSPFLASYIRDGQVNYFTREKGIRSKMLKIDRNQLKKELLIMLYAELYYERDWCIIPKKRNDFQVVLQRLLVGMELDTGELDLAFDYLVENYSEEFNIFVNQKMENFLKNIGIRDNKNNPLYTSCSNYSDSVLNQIHNYRNGIIRFKELSIRNIEEMINRLCNSHFKM